ncbi:MAG: hypothetical protein GY812_02420 [Actinomycetia bacterium]|nr:hypothetical protein [Actinomycetes bacterium]
MATEADIEFWNDTFGTDYATAQAFGRGPENVDEDIKILRSLERSLNGMSDEQKRERLGDDPSRHLRNYIYEIKGKLLRDVRATERGAGMSPADAERVAGNALREVGKIWAQPGGRKQFNTGANWVQEVSRLAGTEMRLEEVDLGSDEDLVADVMSPPLPLAPNMYTDGLTHSPSWYDANMGVGGEPIPTYSGPEPGIFGDKTPAGVIPMDQGWAGQEDPYGVLDRVSPAVRQDATRADRIARERTRNIVPEAAIRSRTVNDLLPEGIGPQEAAAEAERALGITPEGAPSLTPAFDAMTPAQMAGLQPWEAPSMAPPAPRLEPGPSITATDVFEVATPAGTEEVVASVTEPALPDPAAAAAQLDALTPSDYRAPAAPVPGATPTNYALPGSPRAAPEDEADGFWTSPKSIGGAIVGGTGIAAAIGNTIADFRTTAALEDQLAASAAGDTIARREGALAGSQAQRNIMAASLGRRDISPALALRNAQMAGSRTLSDVYGQAAIASARERRESEAQLAQLRKQRWNTLFGGLTRTAGDVGALLATQGAAEETAKMNKRLTDLEAANLNQVGLAPGQRRR